MPDQTINPAEIIRNACIDLTGAAPPEHAIFARLERFQRFALPDDKRGTKTGAVKVMDKGDCYVAIIKNHRTGQTRTVSTRSKNQPLLTPAERAKLEQERRRREQAEQQRNRRKARMLAGMAKRFWAKCRKPDAWDKPHPYITKKQVQPLNIRRYTSGKRDVLVVPMLCLFSSLQSLQIIYPGGFKRPLRGTQTIGLCMGIGSGFDSAAVIWIVEGWATGASLHAHTGEPVLVAFNAGNLQAVTDKALQKFPRAELRLCADDDRATASKPHMNGLNPGLHYAKAVQQRHPQVSLYAPIFPDGSPRTLSDVNDVVNYLRDTGRV